MSSVPQIVDPNRDITTLVNTSQMTKHFPDEVVCEFGKHINKLRDLHALSLTSKHFFVTIFKNTFPAWSSLLASHFPSSFPMNPPQPLHLPLYRSLKAIDSNIRTGTHQLRILSGHQGAVSCLTVKDQILFSGSGDNTIKIWDIENGKEIRTLNGHQAPVCCLTVQDGILFSGSSDNTIKIWDIESGTELKTLAGHQAPVCCLTVQDGILFSGSSDNTIKIWDIENGKELRTLNGHAGYIESLTVQDGILFSGSYDRTIKIWDIASGTELKTLNGHRDNFNFLTVKDGMLFSGSLDNTIKIYDFNPVSNGSSS
jgi:F-box/WD-40 domain protein 7